MNETNIPRQIRTPRLLLRCWEISDAPAVIEAISCSLNELRPWMPWAMNEPQTVEEKSKVLRRFRDEFDSGESYIYGIFTPDQTRVIGSVGSHARIGAGAREIGYWIRSDETGKGYATEAAAAVARVGFEVERLQRIEIHCHPENFGSAAVPQKLGFAHAVTIANCVPNATIGPRDTAIFAMTARDYQRLRTDGASWTQRELRDMLSS